MVRKYHPKRRPWGDKDKRRARVAELRDAGWSLRQIAARLVVSVGTVHRDLIRLNEGVVMQDIASLPRRASHGGYVYALAFDNGVIKPGRTADPYSRLVSHRNGSQVFGVTLAEWWVSPLHDGWMDNEQRLIESAHQLGGTPSGTEYFTGVEFNALVEKAQALDFPTPDASQPWLSADTPSWLMKQLHVYRARVRESDLSEDEAARELTEFLLFKDKRFAHSIVTDHLRPLLTDDSLTTADVMGADERMRRIA